MAKRSAIAEAMREAGGRSPEAGRAPPSAGEAPGAIGAGQPSRRGTKAITGHFAPEVRYQLRLLAAEQNRTMESMLAEALNLLFASYKKAEIATVADRRSEPG